MDHVKNDLKYGDFKRILNNQIYLKLIMDKKLILEIKWKYVRSCAKTREALEYVRHFEVE